MSESPRVYPDKLEVKPLTRPPVGTVRVPGSKSITNRLLVLAAANGRDTTICNALRSEDTEVMVESLRRLGWHVLEEWDENRLTVMPGFGPNVDGPGPIPNDRADLWVGNSGTTVRFLAAMVALGTGTYRLDGVPRMRERPIQDLLDALSQLGVEAKSELSNGCPPIVVRSSGLMGGRARVRGDISSQFLSALLLAAPFANGDVEINLDGSLVSSPYVSMTLDVLRAAGIQIETDFKHRFAVPGRQHLTKRVLAVEPDASAASYFFGIAALTGGTMTVADLSLGSLQGDLHFIDTLEEAGCTVVRESDCLTVHGHPLRGIDVDMNAISDTVMTLAAVACFAEGPTTIRNVAHIRHKETDRLAALATELRRVGAEVDEFADGLTITPRPLHGAEIETYNDHRMAMSMALIGLRVPGVVIKNPGCVAKTYPGFWDDLEKLRA